MTVRTVRDHVERRHPHIDRTLSDQTILDEHRRDHEFGHPGHADDDFRADQPTTTLVSVPHLVHAHGVRADTAAGWDIGMQHQQHTFLHADPADSTFEHNLVDNDLTVPVPDGPLRFDKDILVNVADVPADRLVFLEGMTIADPENLGNVPAAEHLQPKPKLPELVVAHLLRGAVMQAIYTTERASWLDFEDTTAIVDDVVFALTGVRQ